MKRLLAIVLILTLCAPAFGLELVRQKNVATIITVPIVDADGDIVTSAADLDSEIDAWSDGAAPDGFTDCTNEATEIGTNGIYYLSLTQAEMNAQYIYIQIKTSTAGAKTQHILIRTTIGAPANAATTDDGGTINVTGGAVDTVSAATLANGAHGGAAATLTLGGAGGMTATVTGNLTGTTGGVTAAGAATFFSANSGTNYAAAHANSVVKQIADNAGGLSAQDVRDAMKLAPSAGAAAAGSIDALLNTLIERTKAFWKTGVWKAN
ncbi:MAG: hypothetical protein ABFE07_10245 [Armatimonadia bacterium]|nr:hypothetical protein [Planctomycetaceae bacterium]